MAILSQPVQGTWGVGGYNLPDFGVTEYLRSLANKTPSAEVTTRFNNPAVIQQTHGSTATYGPQSTNPYQMSYNPQGQVKGTSTGGGGGYTQQPQRDISPEEWQRHLENERLRDSEQYRNEQEDRLTQQLEASYSPAFNQLNTFEQDYRGQFPLAQQEIEQSYGKVLPQIDLEQQSRLGGLDEQRQSGAREEKGQLSKARQLYNEGLQRGMAMFGGGGTSSTGEAYGELASRTMQQQMGDITSKFGDLRQNIEKEVSNVNNYYQSKKTQMEEEKQLQIRKLQENLDSKLREINNQRHALASEKAARRLEALQAVSREVFQIQSAAKQFSQQLDAWRAYKDEALQYAQQYNAKSFTIPGMNNYFPSIDITRGGGGGGSTAPTGVYSPQDLEKYGYFNYGGKMYPIKTATGSFTDEEVGTTQPSGGGGVGSWW